MRTELEKSWTLFIRSTGFLKSSTDEEQGTRHSVLPQSCSLEFDRQWWWGQVKQVLRSDPVGSQMLGFVQHWAAHSQSPSPPSCLKHPTETSWSTLEVLEELRTKLHREKSLYCFRATGVNIFKCWKERGLNEITVSPGEKLQLRFGCTETWRWIKLPVISLLSVTVRKLKTENLSLFTLGRPTKPDL